VKFRSTAVGAAATTAVAAYNSGDFLHPNDAGYRKIAAIINLNGL
jgi:hypothetical protein